MGFSVGSAVMTGVAMFLGLSWSLLAMQTTWHVQNDFVAKLGVGLTHVDVTGGFAVMVAKQLKDRFKGDVNNGLHTYHITISDMKEVACALDPSLLGATAILTGSNAVAEFCHTWTQTYFASMGLIFCVSFGVFFLLLGSGFMHYYWNVSVRAEPRQWGLFFNCLGPVIFLIGMCQYGFFSHGLSQVRIFPTAAPTYGNAFLMAGALTLLSCVPFVIQVGFMGKDPLEDLNELKAEEKKHAMQDAMAGYGAMEGNYAQGSYPPQQGWDQQGYGQQGYTTQYAQASYPASQAPYGAPDWQQGTPDWQQQQGWASGSQQQPGSGYPLTGSDVDPSAALPIRPTVHQ